MAEFSYPECHLSLGSCMLNVVKKPFMLSVVWLNVVMLSVGAQGIQCKCFDVR
jgi:hypothetical protein